MCSLSNALRGQSPGYVQERLELKSAVETEGDKKEMTQEKVMRRMKIDQRRRRWCLYGVRSL